MAAMAADAVGDETLRAQLRPAGAAVAAHAAALVVMAHHALADARLALAHAGAKRHDDAARLMPGDHRPLGRATDREPAALGSAIGVKIAAAHARSLHGEHDLAGTGRRIRKVFKCELAIAEKNHAFHDRNSEISA